MQVLRQQTHKIMKLPILDSHDISKTTRYMPPIPQITFLKLFWKVGNPRFKNVICGIGGLTIASCLLMLFQNFLLSGYDKSLEEVSDS